MNEQLDPFGINSILFRYSNKGEIVCANGSKFICPLGGGSLRFMHKLFGPKGTNTKTQLETLFGFSLPEDYVNFMRACNGATLFDNSLYLYGVFKNLNRGLSLEEQQPISLPEKIENYQWLHKPNYPWRPFGSVTGYENLFDLEINSAGHVRMHRKGEPELLARSVRELVHALAVLFDGFTSDEGFVGESRRQMDAELSRFISS